VESEIALKRNLFDPSSAQIEWQRGFGWGFYKPLLERRLFGWVACGIMNAKNRMGGYVGGQTFVVVYDGGVLRAETEKYVVCPDDASYKLQPALIDSTAAATGASVADELAKWASLRDKGVITQTEFETEKSKLLGTVAPTPNGAVEVRQD